VEPVQRGSPRHAGTEVITASERIARFYEEADQPVASLLTALGWAEERQAPGRG
jgi:hypothetical protein